MGRKGYQIDEKIKLILINGPKSGKELKNLVKEELGQKLPSKFEKTFDEALIKLLEQEKVKIISYNSSSDDRKVKQAFKSDPLVFDSLKRLTRPDIKNKLDKMEKDNSSYQDIRGLFKKRFEEMIEWNSRNWQNLKNCIFSWPADQTLEFIQGVHGTDSLCQSTKRYMPFLREREKIGDKIYSYEPGELSDCWHIGAEFAVLDKENRLCPRNLNDLPYIRAKKLEERLYNYSGREDVRVWFYPCTPVEYENIWTPPPDPNYTKTGLHYHVEDGVLYDGFRSLIEDDLGPIKINVGSEWSKEDALYNAGFYPHFFQMKDDPDLAFEHTVDMISTYTNDNVQVLNSILAKGLSDEPGSLQVFIEFFRKVTSVLYSDRLNNVLGIISEHTETVSYDEFKNVEERMKHLDWYIAAKQRREKYPKPE